jgi:hypothetical protein
MLSYGFALSYFLKGRNEKISEVFVKVSKPTVTMRSRQRKKLA